MQNLPVEATKKTKKSWKFTEKMSFFKMLFFCLLNYTNRSRGKGAATCDERLTLVKAWRDANTQLSCNISWLYASSGWQVLFHRKKMVPTWSRSGLRIFFPPNNQCMSSKKRHFFFNITLFWHIKGKAGRSQTFLQTTVKSPKLDDSLKRMNSTTWRKQTCRFSLGWTATLKEQCNSVRGIYVNMKEPAAVVSYGGCEQCKETDYLTQKR